MRKSAYLRIRLIISQRCVVYHATDPALTLFILKMDEYISQWANKEFELKLI